MIGIITGLLAALTQSLSYVASSHYIQRRKSGAGLQLLVISHQFLGLFSLIVLFFVWMPGLDWHAQLVPLAIAALCNILGQLGLMQAIKYSEPSRVSPLLTIKVFIPAALATLIGQPVGSAVNRSLTAWQWVAVLLCVIAGISINQSGGRMRLRALVAVIFSASTFAGADWTIGVSEAAFMRTPHMTLLRASLLTESALYLTLVAVALPLLLVFGSRKWRDWRDAAPFGIAWFTAMIFLFFTFGTEGVVLGTILQCTRGFMAILIGIVLMHLGLEHIEPRQSHSVMLRRLAAGFLMFLAISLYLIRDPVNAWRHAAVPAATAAPAADASH